MNSRHSPLDPCHVSRRDFLALSAGVAGLAVVSTGAGAAHSYGYALKTVQPDKANPKASTFFAWKDARTARGCTVSIASGFGGNSTLIFTSTEAVLIDCKNAPYGKALRREATARIGADAKIMKVINTHHHADHTGGNHAMNNAAASPLEIIAHDKCTERVLGQMNRYIAQSKEAASQIPAEKEPTAAVEQVRSDALEYYDGVKRLTPTDFVPKVTFAKQLDVMLEGMPTALSLEHHGNGHTDNDITIFCPHANVIVMGDLLFHGLHPFIDRGSGADTKAWRAALEVVIKLCDKDTVIVPGHGELTDVQGLRAQVEYLDRANDAVAAAIKEGKSRAQIAEVTVPQFKGLGNERFAGTALQAIFDEQTARTE